MTRHEEILDFLRDHDQEEGISQGEAGRHFDDVSSSYQPRFRELERDGLIELVGFKKDVKTGRKVKSYRLVNRAKNRKAV